jgi:hypothetical protein
MTTQRDGGAEGEVECCMSGTNQGKLRANLVALPMDSESTPIDKFVKKIPCCGAACGGVNTVNGPSGTGVSGEVRYPVVPAQAGTQVLFALP